MSTMCSLSTRTRRTAQCDPADFAGAYSRIRRRSRALFDLLSEEAYYSRPILARHPVVFYEGHLPAFSFNTLIKGALGRTGIDAWLERLFARGIDPTGPVADGGARAAWPDRDVVHAFVDEADRQISDALAHEDLIRTGDPLLDGGEAVFAILEHELMPQETLQYIWYQMPHAHKRRPREYVPLTRAPHAAADCISVPSGVARLGVDRGALPFGWDNEPPGFTTRVAPFRMQQTDVTNERWWTADDGAWVQRAGVRHPLFWTHCDGAWWWRGMFEWIPLPASWPVYVSHAEASAFARWAGARLPSEEEFQLAAFGGSEDLACRHPWVDADAAVAHGVFDFSSWDPEPAGSHPAAANRASTISWETGGSGRAAALRPFPGSRRLIPIPSTRSTFSTGRTSS